MHALAIHPNKLFLCSAEPPFCLAHCFCHFPSCTYCFPTRVHRLNGLSLQPLACQPHVFLERCNFFSDGALLSKLSLFLSLFPSLPFRRLASESGQFSNRQKQRKVLSEHLSEQSSTPATLEQAYKLTGCAETVQQESRVICSVDHWRHVPSVLWPARHRKLSSGA